MSNYQQLDTDEVLNHNLNDNTITGLHEYSPPSCLNKIMKRLSKHRHNLLGGLLLIIIVSCFMLSFFSKHSNTSQQNPVLKMKKSPI